ncbi:hypothetical protein [Acidisphaera sp. S103]|uniref:hypothetical protein n=1 Tax=Acidisphaera sp. S103 TaxID=1747223 RepID=UPI00131AF2C1|nr:hypothetical protein [Acidisphaera sp. S103]
MKPPRKPLSFDMGEAAPEAELRHPVAAHVQPQAAPPIVERQQLGVRISKAVYQRLKIHGIKSGARDQDLVERAIVELLEREGG